MDRYVTSPHSNSDKSTSSAASSSSEGGVKVSEGGVKVSEGGVNVKTKFQEYEDMELEASGNNSTNNRYETETAKSSNKVGKYS